MNSAFSAALRFTYLLADRTRHTINNWGIEQVSKIEQLGIEQVRKRGLPPPLLGWDERGQAPLPDLFYFYSMYVPWLFYSLSSIPDLSYRKEGVRTGKIPCYRSLTNSPLAVRCCALPL